MTARTRAILAALLAFLVPPAGLFWHMGPSRRTYAVSGAWAVGQLIFWLVAAGPGFLLAAASSCAAVYFILWPLWRTAPANAKPPAE